MAAIFGASAADGSDIFAYFVSREAALLVVYRRRLARGAELRLVCSMTRSSTVLHFYELVRNGDFNFKM